MKKSKIERLLEILDEEHPVMADLWEKGELAISHEKGQITYTLTKEGNAHAETVARMLMREAKVA